MAIEMTDFSLVLQEALTERDNELQEKELPAINIGAAIPVSEGLDSALDYFEFGVSEVLGSVYDGLIGTKTNSLVTIDSQVEIKKAPLMTWGKAATWTMQEAEKVKKLDIALESKKQDELYKNALSTIQYAGYVGHRQAIGQEGLLTGSKVTVINSKVNKTLDKMTSDEFVSLILDAYNVAWKASGYTVQPTHIAMDASDYMLAMQKFDTNSVIVDTQMLPISAMDRVLAALRKASGDTTFSIEFVKVPEYAKQIVDGKTRLAIYTYDSDYVEMKVKMPELLPVRQRDLLTYECGYVSAFTGALWKEPASAVYVDYKSA